MGTTTDPVVAVDDLGAGTLKVSFFEVDDNVYDVEMATGDNNYGSKDFDVAISRVAGHAGCPGPAT